jgi:TRAP-type C4-dicarboxylate transport system permease small subunit
MTALTWNSPVGSISWLTLGRVYLILPTGISLMLIYLVAWALEILKELRDITKAKAG